MIFSLKLFILTPSESELNNALLLFQTHGKRLEQDEKTFKCGKC